MKHSAWSIEHSDMKAPNSKSQISITRIRNKTFLVIRIGNLELIWDLEFVILDSKLYALCSMLFANFAGGNDGTRL